MNEFEREVFRDTRRNTAARRLGSDRAMCLICGNTNPHVLSRGEGDHLAGEKFAEDTAFVCRNCHAERSELQREQPAGAACGSRGAHGPPPNPLEVIGRWLLGMAEYFELLKVTLRRFGEYLIGLARQGYGSDLTFS